MEMTQKLAPPISILVVEEDDLSREILATIIPKSFPTPSCTRLPTARQAWTHENVPAGHRYYGYCHIRDGWCPDGDRIPSVKPDTKLIVITTDSERQVRKDAPLSSITVDHYLFKPVCCPDLFAAIEQCIAKVAGGRSSQPSRRTNMLRRS